MDAPDAAELRKLLRRRVEIWEDAEVELRAVRIRDAAANSVADAIRQLFTGMEHLLFLPSPATSGLIEQQMWFSRIREAGGDSGKPADIRSSPRPHE